MGNEKVLKSERKGALENLNAFFFLRFCIIIFSFFGSIEIFEMNFN